MAQDVGEYDVAIVGASLAGCTAAILLARAGARVALIEKSPDPNAYKHVCSHFIQASAVPTIERLGLYEPILAAGGLRSRFHSWTRWGWIEPTERREAFCLNLRRELLDPMLREQAAAQSGVELMLGLKAEELIGDGGTCRGVVVHDREGASARSGQSSRSGPTVATRRSRRWPRSRTRPSPTIASPTAATSRGRSRGSGPTGQSGSSIPTWPPRFPPMADSSSTSR